VQQLTALVAVVAVVEHLVVLQQHKLKTMQQAEQAATDW
jgi:hypothetical protein